MKTEKNMKKIPYLDYMCLPGETVQWENILGEKHIGELINIDENSVATVKLLDDTIVEIKC